MIRYLGYACVNTELKKKNIYTNRSIREKNYCLDSISELVLQNVKDLYSILVWNYKNEIYLFRISSDIFPFYDHPDLGYQLINLKDYGDIYKILKKCGRFARNKNMRLTCHPSHYTCLASRTTQTANTAMDTIEMVAMLGDILGYPDFDINIHIGGVYNDKVKTALRFNTRFKVLSESARRKIRLENDHSPNGYSIRDLHKLVYQPVGIPLTLDMHHWTFNSNRDSLENDAELARSTWPNIPKMHYSESIPGHKNKTAHSDYINHCIPEFDFEYDVIVEAKEKEQAIIDYRLSQKESPCIF